MVGHAWGMAAATRPNSVDRRRPLLPRGRRGVAVQTVACLVAGASLAACSSAPGHGLSVIPTLAHGSSAGASGAPAIALPSPGAVVYRVEGRLPALVDQAIVYRVDATGTAAQVTRLATALGLSGPLRTDASGWTIADGERQLRVERVGGLPWTFSGSASGTASSGCAVAVPGSPGGDRSTSSTPPPTCPPTTTVPGLLDERSATQRAIEVLGHAGIDVAGDTVAASGSSEAWTVTFSPLLDGREVLGGTTSVAVGAHGSIVSASGHLAEPSPAGSYPLVGLAAAIDRLRQGWDWIVYSGPVPLAGQGAPAAQSVGAGAGDQGEPGATSPPGAPGESAPSSSLPESTEPQPTAPTTTVAPTVVEITGVRLAVAWAWPSAPAGQAAWVVPVYVFELGSGSPYPFLRSGVPVLAVADRYVTTPTLTAVGSKG